MNSPRPHTCPQEGASGKPSTGFRLWQPGGVLLALVLLALPARAMAPGWPWPVPTDPPAITGTFMESRETRFHTGLDIRTAGSTGWPVHSPVDGSVRRIRSSARGYGLALYVESISGETLVFAHLDRFFHPAAERLSAAQASSGHYEQDLEFARGVIPVVQGDVIALSGETGTGAPHLHFEVRDANQRPLNPADFLNVPDSVAPEIRGVRLIPADPRAPVPIELSPAGGTVPARGRWMVEVLAVDKTGHAPFPVAPRALSLYVDGTLHYRLANDAVAFSQLAEMRLDQRRDPRGRWYRMLRREGLTLPGREGPGTLIEVSDRPVELWIVVEDAVGLKAETRIELAPGRAEPAVRENGLEVGSRLLVASLAGTSEMPPLLEGPDTHHLLESVPGGWRLAIEHAALTGGTWKLLHRGELVIGRELRFPRDGIQGGGFAGTPSLEPASGQRLFAGGALELRGIDVQPQPGMRPVGRGLELVSHDFVPVRPLSFSPPESDLPHTMMMRFDGRNWSPLGDGNTSDAFGTFVLMEDLAPPSIGDLRGVEPIVIQRTGPRSAHGVPLPPWPELEIPVSDGGSGLPDTGPVVTLDGRPWPVRYDGERERLLLDWFVAPAPGLHELTVHARDRAGRESVRSWQLEFRH